MTHKAVFVEDIFTLRNLRSMGAAALVELLLGLGVAGILIWQSLQPVPPPKPSPPPGLEIPLQAPPLPHHVQVPVPPQPQQPHLSQVPPVPSDVPSPLAVPVQPPLAPTTSRPPQGVANEFAAGMLRAINDQKVYPKTEMVKGHTGEAVVSFDYADGVVSNVQVVTSSGWQALDDAAVQAVLKAALPPKPPELANLNHFVFHLSFDLDD